MILVDSSVWIDYFNGNTTIASEKLDSLLGIRPICTGDLILTGNYSAVRKIEYL
jgi:predicted nucleic acid-binding protein